MPLFLILWLTNEQRKCHKEMWLGILNQITQSLLAALLIFPPVVGLGFVIWASISVVFNLLRYKQWVQHIHRNISRIFLDMRATQSILILVSTFVTFLLSLLPFHLIWLFLKIPVGGCWTPLPWSLHVFQQSALLFSGAMTLLCPGSSLCAAEGINNSLKWYNSQKLL